MWRFLRQIWFFILLFNGLLTWWALPSSDDDIWLTWIKAQSQVQWPNISHIPSNLLTNCTFLNSFHFNVSSWITAIQALTKLTRDIFSYTTSQKVNFWLSLEMNFHNLHVWFLVYVLFLWGSNLCFHCFSMCFWLLFASYWYFILPYILLLFLLDSKPSGWFKIALISH